MLEIVDRSGNIIPPISDPVTGHNSIYKATAGMNLSSGRVVYVKDGLALYFDPMDSDLYGLLIGVTKTAASYLNPVEIQLSGAFYESGLGLISGRDYFAGQDGTLTVDPTGLKIVQSLGSSIDSNILNININTPIETI